MKCFEKYIGICGIYEGTSGYDITDLEGINLRLASNIADSSYKSGVALLEKKIEIAQKKVIQELRSNFLPLFRMNLTVDELKVGDFKTNYLAVSPNERGVKIVTSETRLSKIYVDKVKIELDDGGIPVAGVLNITDNNTITTYNFTTDGAGVSEFNVDYMSESTTIYLTIDNTLLQMKDAEVKKGCGCGSNRSKNLKAHGWTGTSTSTSTYGIQAYVTAECDVEEFACIISHHLGLPILYKSGIEIIKELFSSDRLNSFTLLKDEQAEFLLDDYQKEYKKLMTNLVNSLPDLAKKIDDVCVVCKQSRYVESFV
tara:strand:+ start:221 stop:1159 length:939 start_codon:yes stop_codon:yes gene_type:complete